MPPKNRRPDRNRRNSSGGPGNQKQFSKPRRGGVTQPPPQMSHALVDPPVVIPVPVEEIPVSNPDYIIIAKIAAPFGLRGAVKAEIRTDFPERFSRLKEVWLQPPDASADAPRQNYNVMSARVQNEKQVVIRFEAITKIEQAETLRGYTVAVPRGDVVPLPEGEYYIFQLIGLKVYSEKGEYVGQVVNVLNYPANDVYEVRGPLSPNTVLIPAVADIVKNIDLEQQRITIDLLEGLI